MHHELDGLAVIGSSILALIHFATIVVDDDSWHKCFADGTDNRKELEQILSNLQIDQNILKVFQMTRNIENTDIAYVKNANITIAQSQIIRLTLVTVNSSTNIFYVARLN